MFDLDGKVAVVTGGVSGIGLATVERLAAAGATVVIADIQDGAEVAARVDGLFVRADLTKDQDVTDLLDATVERYERLDIMVNNVGGGTPAAGVESLETEALEYDFRLNTLTAQHGMRHAAPRMQAGGAIVNTASIAGLRGVPDLGAYVAAKWALVGLTKTAAIELAPRGIRVNCVCPGVINTPLAHDEDVAYIVKAAYRTAPLGRLGRPEEIAAAIHFLCAGDCGYITGQAIAVDGGTTAGISTALLELAGRD
ncbi:MAG TPA: SDR family oxidoreductase [Acidobacteriota bacterium]|nr:SDR family oxidoreductase [Acidobacteriota bacterium]